MLSWLPFIVAVLMSGALVYLGSRSVKHEAKPKPVRAAKNPDGGDPRITYERSH